MSNNRDDFVSAKLAKMTLLEKCGQVLTFTWRGAYLTPSGIEQITKLARRRRVPGAVRAGNLQEPLLGTFAKWIRTSKSRRTTSISRTLTLTTAAIGVSVTPEELTAALNKLQEIAMNRPSGIPLHVTIDMEGDFKNDYTSGHVVQFPPPMGMTAIGDLDLAYKVANTLGQTDGRHRRHAVLSPGLRR